MRPIVPGTPPFLSTLPLPDAVETREIFADGFNPNPDEVDCAPFDVNVPDDLEEAAPPIREKKSSTAGKRGSASEVSVDELGEGTFDSSTIHVPSARAISTTNASSDWMRDSSTVFDISTE